MNYRNKLFTFLLLMLGTTLQLSAAPFLELSPTNWKQKMSNKTVLVYFSLGCDMGSYASQMFSEAMEELSGVYIATYSVNDAYEMMQGNSYDLGSIALIKNGKVLESSEDTYKDFHFLSGYNNQQYWVYNALKNNGISFSMPKPGSPRMAPANDVGYVNLKDGLKATYRFNGDNKDSSGNGGEFRMNGHARIHNNAFYCNGEYDEKYSGGSHSVGSYGDNTFKNGFAVHARVKVNSSEEQRKFVLSVGYRVIDIEINKDKLLLGTSLYHHEEGDKYTYVDDFYPLSEVPFKYDTWNSIILSTDIQSRRMYIMINGVRYKDIRLSERFVKFYTNYGGMGTTGVRMHNHGWGGILNGYADDIVMYNRKINVSEMKALYKKYNSGTVVDEPTEDPVIPEDTDVKAKDWAGDWDTHWGDGETIHAHFKVSGTKVIGDYEYNNGVLFGHLSNEGGQSVAEGTWSQKNSKGWFKFVLSKDGKSFKGEWGSFGENTPSGEWSGRKK